MNDLTLYQLFRGQIVKNGTGGLLLWSADSMLGEAIRGLGPKQSDVLKEKVNHSSIVVLLRGVASGEVRVFNYESDSDGFNPHFLSNELGKYEGVVFWLPLRPEYDRAAIEGRCMKYDGTPYDYHTLLKMAFMRPEIDTSEMICSESVEVVVTGNIEGPVHAPGELPDLGCWGLPIQILGRM